MVPIEADSRMRKHKKLLIAIAFLVASVGLFFAFRGKPEPIYGGCTLSYWADRYAKAYWNQRAFLPNLGYAGVDAEAEEAIRAIGTNALPSVLEWLHFEQGHCSVRLFYSLRLNRLPSPWKNRMHELAFVGNTWVHTDLSRATGTPTDAGPPFAYVRSDGVSSIVYCGADRHIHELALLPA